MNKNIYRNTRYPGIKQNIKNKNYIIDMFVNGKRSSISTVDGKKNGAKIMDISTAKKIKENPSIQKRFSYAINNKTTTDEAFEIYMYDAEHNMQLSKRTLNKKRSAYKLYLKKLHGSKKLFSLSKEDMLDVKIQIDKKNNTNSSKYTVLKEIKAFFNWLVRNKILDESPLQEIMQFKKERIIHEIWTPLQVDIFRKECEKDFNNENFMVSYKARLIHLLVNVDYVLSARIGETRALQYSKVLKEQSAIKISADIGIDGNIVEQTKTDESKDIIPIPAKIIDEIDDFKKWIEDNYLITLKKEYPIFMNLSTLKPYSSCCLYKIYNMYVERANLPRIKIYNLRHSGVALMQELGTPLDVIQNRVRHKNIETTINTYGTVSSNTKKKLVEDISKFF